MDSALQKLIEWLETASPELWRILIRQVYVAATLDLLWAIGLSVAIILLTRKLAQYTHSEDYDCVDDETVLVVKIGWTLLYGSWIAIAALVASAAAMIANPEYAAIRDILRLVTNSK